jgi:hypothetical protein
MKKYPIYLCTIIVFFVISCKKSNSGGNTNEAATSYVSSVISTSSQQQIIDSFTYDSTHRLGSYMITIYDTTSGYPQFNSQVLKFLYNGSNTYPSYYNAYDTALGNTNGDYHLLSYDAQNRITKDTSLSGSGYVAYYSYPSNNLAATILWEGTLQDNLVDTLYMANGNMGTEIIYDAEIPGQPDVQQAILIFPTLRPPIHAITRLQPIASANCFL